MIKGLKTSLRINKSLTLQQDQLDCGPAALLSVIKFYDGFSSIEQVRQLSGTGLNGTTLLGLFKTAKYLGFEAEGCTVNLNFLLTQTAPCILHVNLPIGQHYLIFYGVKKTNKKTIVVVGDPAIGIRYMSVEELSQIWISKACLLLKPTSEFKTGKESWNIKRKWLSRLLQDDKDLIIISIGLGVVIATLGLAMSIFSQKLIDGILPKNDVKGLIIGLAFVFLLLVIRESLSGLRQFFLSRQSKAFSVRVVDFFYTHLVAIPTSFFHTRKIGDLTARLNDTSRIQRVISQLISNLINDLLIALTAIIFIFSKSWRVGLLSLLILPVYYLLIYLNNSKIVAGQKRLMSNYASTESNYISTLQGISIIKNFNKQELYSNINKTLYQSYQLSQFSLSKIQIKLGVSANIFGTVFMIAVLAVASWQVLTKQLLVGELVAILGMSSTLLPSVASLALLAIPVNEAKVALDRMFEFTEIRPETDNGKQSIEDIIRIEVKNLQFNYAYHSPILKNISFSVVKGEFVAIMGENGCGKSTLIQLLQRDFDPAKGEIILNSSISLSDVEISSLRKHYAVVPQSIHLFNGTILENIAFDDVVNHPDTVIDFVNKSGIAAYFEKNLISFNTIIGEEGINLSGGQKQVIAVARALYHYPKVLILDEATAAMDRDTEIFVLQLLSVLKKDMIIIFITHRLHILRRYSDRIYLIENGIISAQGKHTDLIKTKNLYSAYWADYTN